MRFMSFAAAAVTTVVAWSSAAALPSGSPTPDAAEIALSTRTPIKHLIVVVGENVTFDTLFGTYVPEHKRESIRNLLSEHIVNADGTPGPRYFRAVQFKGANLHNQYTVDPVPVAPYARLPQPTLIGVFNPATLQPFGAIPDPRFAALDANGPFQITDFLKYGDPATFATGDPVHRFFQMWQQTGGTNEDLHSFAWVAITTGQGGDTAGITPASPGQGAELMGFFNMATGDAPYFKSLAQTYALSDNYHQAILGGTGANFFMLATGDAAVYNQNGQLAVPPANQIENPDPAAGTDNFYVHDGYSGGSYVNCSDSTQPAVDAILDNIRAHGRRPNCASGAYYLVNNYEPPYAIDGTPKTLGPQVFAYPPQTVPTIGEALSAKGVSWKWYTGGRDPADVTGDALYPVIRGLVQSQVPAGTPAAIIDAIAFKQTQPLLYNSIGDPHNGSSTVVNSSLRNNLKGLASFYQDVSQGTLPAVSYVVPKNLDSGHPGYSAPPRYEVFIKDLIARVQANPQLWQSTAILVTTDEGGGYFDTGRIQNLDFFGDGPRIPLIVVSPFARQGHVDHVYNDHASILKFIEHNWKLRPLSDRSRDRLPNPFVFDDDEYLPVNSPAIGDLTSLFEFSGEREHDRND
jgi:acid phosphatase